MVTALRARIINVKSVRMRYFFTALGFLVAMITLYASPFTASALTGAGTSGSPYQISSCADFKDINDDLDAYYTLTQHLNCTADAMSIMVGNAQPFTGNFNGNNRTITVSMIDSGYRNVGLFSELDGATVRNLAVAGTINISEADGTVGESIGAIAGQATSSTLDNVSRTAFISGDLTVGGIVGTATLSTITDASSVGSVVSRLANGGGLQESLPVQR